MVQIRPGEFVSEGEIPPLDDPMPTQEELDTQVERVFAEWEKTAPKGSLPVVLIEDAPSEADAALAQESTDPEFANLLSCLAELADSVPGLATGEVTITTGHGLSGPVPVEKHDLFPAAHPAPAPAPLLQTIPPKIIAKGRRLPLWVVSFVAIPLLAAGILGLLYDDILTTPVSPAPPAIDLTQDETRALTPPVENQESPRETFKPPPPPLVAPVAKAEPLPVPPTPRTEQSPAPPPPPAATQTAVETSPNAPQVMDAPPSENPAPTFSSEPSASDPTDEIRDETTVTQVEPPISAALVPPQLIQGTRSSPVYPPMAMRTRTEGRVVLQVTVLKDGTVGDTTVTQGPTPDVGFRKAAIQAVRTWHYRPALRSGIPVDMPITVVIDFRLN